MTDPVIKRPESPPSASERRWSRAVAVLALAAAFISLLAATSWARQRRDLLTLVREAELGDTPLLRRLERETTEHHAQLVAARALVYHTLTLHGEEATEARRRAVVAKLPDARQLARHVLESQPNSWQAAMLLGTSRYLEWSIHRDDRLYTEAAAWERPLEKAVRNAAGHPEPRRILTTAYLEVWHALSPAKKERAQELLVQVFEDDLRAFEALAPVWLGLGLDLETSLAVVPEDPTAWDLVKRAFAKERRWPAFIIAHRRGLAALETQLRDRRDEGQLRLRLGDFVDSRSILLRVIQGAPPSRRFLPLAASALELYPPGLHGLASTSSLEPWVDWSLELSRLGLDGLPPKAMGLLLDAIVGEDFPPSKAALMALRAEDPYQAERFEKLAQPLTLAEWAPYLIAKSAGLAAAGEGQRANEALVQVALAARSSLPYLIVAPQVAAARGDLAAEEDALERLDQARRRDYPATSWRARRKRPTLDLLSDAAAGLSIEIRKAPATGAVVEVLLDGHSLDLRPVLGGDRLRFDVEVEPGPHLLEVVSLAGGSVTPGAVTLRGANPAQASE